MDGPLHAAVGKFQFLISSRMHAFGVWEETGAPGGNSKGRADTEGEDDTEKNRAESQGCLAGRLTITEQPDHFQRLESCL